MQPFMKLFMTVLLAHLLGDFPLQSSSMVRDKEHGIRGYIAHGAVHLVALLVSLAGFVGLAVLRSFWFWIAACVYIAAHLGIDRLKQQLLVSKKLADSASIFLVD